MAQTALGSSTKRWSYSALNTGLPWSRNGAYASHSSNSWHCSFTAKSKSSTSWSIWSRSFFSPTSRPRSRAAAGEEPVEVELVVARQLEAGVVRVAVDVVGLDPVAPPLARPGRGGPRRRRAPTDHARRASVRPRNRRGSRRAPPAANAVGVGSPALVRPGGEVADHEPTVGVQPGDQRRIAVEQIDVVHVDVVRRVEPRPGAATATCCRRSTPYRRSSRRRRRSLAAAPRRSSGKRSISSPSTVRNTASARRP